MPLPLPPRPRRGVIATRCALATTGSDILGHWPTVLPIPPSNRQLDLLPTVRERSV